MQVKLLRAIQEKAVRRIGDARETFVDVRIICATHKTSKHSSKAAHSVKTYTTASTSLPCICRPCAKCAKTWAR